MYMNSMVRAAAAPNATLTNPGKLRSLAETATKALTVDHGLGTVKKLYDLGNELKKVPTEAHHHDHDARRYREDGTGWCRRATPSSSSGCVREDIALDGKDKKKATDRARRSPRTRPPRRTRSPSGAERHPHRRPGRRSAGRASTVTELLVGKGFTKAAADPRRRPREATTVIRYPSADLRATPRRSPRRWGSR